MKVTKPVRAYVVVWEPCEAIDPCVAWPPLRCTKWTC